MSGSVARRPGSWWLQALRKRATSRRGGSWDGGPPPHFETEAQRRAAIKYFNAAFRAEQSGAGQAEQLASQVSSWDPELAEMLDLYGKEEAWHRQLLTGFLKDLGGGVQPMGKVTKLFFSAYARARRMETIVLTNLMFETIGATTYRMTLPRVRQESVRRMLSTLASDESFHVPLNVYFLKRVLSRCSEADLRRLQRIHHALFVALVALPLASRPKSKAFDTLGTAELARAYAEQLARVFDADDEVPLAPPRWLLRLLGASQRATHS